MAILWRPYIMDDIQNALLDNLQKYIKFYLISTLIIDEG